MRALVENGFDSVKLDGCGKQTNMSLYAELQRQSGKTFETENCKCWRSACPPPPQLTEALCPQVTGAS